MAPAWESSSAVQTSYPSSHSHAVLSAVATAPAGQLLQAPSPGAALYLPVPAQQPHPRSQGNQRRHDANSRQSTCARTRSNEHRLSSLPTPRASITTEPGSHSSTLRIIPLMRRHTCLAGRAIARARRRLVLACSPTARRQALRLCHHDTLGNATRAALLLRLRARRSPASQAVQPVLTPAAAHSAAHVAQQVLHAP